MGLAEIKSCLLGILKAWDPFINYMTVVFKQLISNIKLDKTLEYIILNALEMIPPHSHKNKKTLLRGQKMLHVNLLLTS
jgi:hypothetical protein